MRIALLEGLNNIMYQNSDDHLFILTGTSHVALGL